MTAFRVTALAIAAVSLPALGAPAAAQVSDEIVLNILRNCAQIDDATARLACYDNNIRAAGGNPRNSVPGQMAVPNGGTGAPIAAQGGAAGFGAEDIRTPDRFQTPAGQVDELTARVAAVAQQQPGIYLVTLEDGAQWLFTDSVSFSFRPPRVGDRVSIDRASLGSFLMTVGQQPSVRVRRVR
ncbi:MAG: hypothetical protein KDE15_14300 [Erythrobacter sp.]|nr:hypothetical protein [Erythrobacter sp.]